jgi:hypothetical protein
VALPNGDSGLDILGSDREQTLRLLQLREKQNIGVLDANYRASALLARASVP